MEARLALLALACLCSWADAANPTDGISLVIGGFGGGNSMEVTTTNTVCRGLPNAPSGTIEGWVAEYVDGQVYLCGGADINQVSKCFALTPGGSWSEVADENVAFEFAASTVHEGQMVISGGYNDNNGWLDVVQRKASGSDEWESLSEWKLPRGTFDHCMASTGEGRLIIAGGNVYGADYLTEVEMLDTTNGGSWELVGSIPSGRSRLGCLTTEYNGELGLMITGGCIEGCLYHIPDAAFFSYSTLTWTELPPLMEARNGHKMTHINGMPTVIGGYNQALMGAIEMFDGTNWVSHPKKLEFPRYAYAMPENLPDTAFAC